MIWEENGFHSHLWAVEMQVGSVIQKRRSKNERKGAKRMVGEVDGGVRKKV